MSAPPKLTQAELTERQRDMHLCMSCQHSDVCRVPNVLGHLVDHWKLAVGSCALYDREAEKFDTTSGVIR